MIEINIENINDGSFSLMLGEINYMEKADAYYFAIDHDFMPDEDSTFKVLLNVKNLINSWVECIESSVLKTKGFVFYLPFNFQDEYIGFLRLELIGLNRFLIDCGYTEELGGYSISPSNKRCLNTSDMKKYKVTSANFEYDYDSLLEDIKNMIRTIDHRLLPFLN